MTNLEELIQTAQKLSMGLEIASEEEKRFCVDSCLRLEQLSWEIFRAANELEAIKNYDQTRSFISIYTQIMSVDEFRYHSCYHISKKQVPYV